MAGTKTFRPTQIVILTPAIIGCEVILTFGLGGPGSASFFDDMSGELGDIADFAESADALEPALASALPPPTVLPPTARPPAAGVVLP